MNYDDIRIMALSLAKVGLGNPLPKEDYKEICDFIRKNLEVLIKHFETDNEFDDDELWEALKENGAIKKKIWKEKKRQRNKVRERRKNEKFDISKWRYNRKFK